jgi:GT2 family glycosyltransferase
LEGFGEGANLRRVPRASVIVPTFNQPRLLDLSLRSFARQSSLDFELVVADFGSGPDTAECVRERAAASRVRLEHVVEAGGRRADALNRAVLRGRGDYLIFVGGDSVVPSGFVEAHLGARRPGRYLVGGYVRRSPDSWERQAPVSRRLAELARWGGRAARISLGWPERPAPRGQTFSVDRGGFFRVNGYDQSLSGAEEQDLDLRLRLQLAGLHPRALGPGSRVRLLGTSLRSEQIARPRPQPGQRRGHPQLEAVLGLRELAEGPRAGAARAASPFSFRSV